MGYRFFIFFLVSNLVHWNKAEILCYECTTTATYENIMKNETAKLCSKFDKIEEYEISCPYSTFCMKKTSELVLADGKAIRIEERNCASQSSYQQKFKNNKWVKERIVDETVYEDGCTPELSENLKASKIEYCFCSSNFCNTSKRSVETSLFHHTDAMSVIFIFNVVKLMRSVR